MELNKNEYRFEVIYIKKGSAEPRCLYVGERWNEAVEKADEYRVILSDFNVIQSMYEIKVAIYGLLSGLCRPRFIEKIEWREDLKDVLTRCANDDVAEWVKEAHDQKDRKSVV